VYEQQQGSYRYLGELYRGGAGSILSSLKGVLLGSMGGPKGGEEDENFGHAGVI